ncbi:MAG TPA: hypothetical protein VNG31_03490 [Candidatus Baltobacteraceae bacterium]|nr:hypothetical protein [Candidatus Baltobacteraceae bacterium]
MTMTTLPPEVTPEFEAAQQLRTDAEAVLFSTLVSVVDLTTLTSAHDGYDYHVKVPASNLHVVMKKLSDIEYDIEEAFKIRIRVLPVPVEG